MNKILKRPMFNMGGRAGAMDSGIISGFAKPSYKIGGAVQRQGFSRGSYVDMLDQYMQEPVKPQGMTTSDYLRLAAAGAQIMGAPVVSDKGGVMGALANAATPLANLGTDLAASRDTRDAAYRKELADYNRLKAGTAIEQRVTEDANKFQRDLQQDEFDFREGESAKDRTFELTKIDEETKAAVKILQKELELFPDKYKKEVVIKEDRANELIEEMKNPNLSEEEYLQKKDILTNVIYGEWTRLITSEKSDLMKDADFLEPLNQAIRNAVKASKIEAGEEGYPNKYTGMTASAIREKLTREAFESAGLIDLYVPPYSGREESAVGGRVGRSMGGDMPDALPTPGFEPGSGPDPDPGSPPIMTASADQPMALTFEELRKRLPNEVSDSVIQLILSSEEAMIDFAQLQTSQDITRFNQKYNTDLELPTVA